jgi:hypothetical protein
MKKILVGVLSLIIGLSFIGCTKKEEVKEKQTSTEVQTEAPKPAITKFTDILDQLSDKDYYYADETGNIIKILDVKVLEAYNKKAEEIRIQVMKEKSIDLANAKVYPYFRNVNGEKSEKDYVIVYNSDKTATEVYEVIMTVSDTDEPVLKEVNKLDGKLIDDNFTKFFKDELQ